MYTCHLGVYRRALIVSLGGFRKGFEGAQDHDLVLRLSETTDRIYHIPKVLYHWRRTSKSTAANPHSKTYAFEAGHKAVKRALERRGIDGWTESIPDIPGVCLVHYRPKAKPLVSIIILTKDQAAILDQCLLSVFSRTEYSNYEIILVDNGSREEETFAAFDKWRKIFLDKFRVLRIDLPFNFSYLNNRAAGVADGDILLLLNNDTEVRTAGWMGEMVGWAQRDEIGAVGACLLYPDKRIQHAGVVLGITGNPAMRGVAGHSHKGLPEDSLGYFSRLKFVSNYSAVTGACLMVRKSVYLQVGGLDESLAYAFNDVDFCLRLLQKGLRNVVLPQAKLIHHESKSRGYEDSPEKQKRFGGEIAAMLSRWDKLLERDPYYSPHLSLWREDFSLKSKEEYRRCGGDQLL
jgi:GT2 family glycosyltransferase